MIDLLERRRRPIGAGLLAYGISGIVAGILVVVATIAVAAGREPAIGNVDRQRDAVVATLARSTSMLERTADVVDDAAGDLASAAQVGFRAAEATGFFSATLSRPAGTFGSFSVPGSAPFAPLAARLRVPAGVALVIGISLLRRPKAGAAVATGAAAG